MPRQRVRSWTVLTASALVLLAGSAAPALAQARGSGAAGERSREQQPGDGQRRGQRGDFGGGGMGGMGGGGGMFARMFGPGGRGGESAVEAEDLARYAKMLNLSADQSQAVTALHEAYTQSLESERSAFRDKMDEMRQKARESGEPGGFQQLATEGQKFRDKTAQLETGFFSDMKAVLTQEQLAKWPSFEQTRRREVSMARGVMSGERVDLVRIVENLKLAPDALTKVQPALDQYATDLDRELVERTKFQDEAQKQGREIFQNMDFDAAQRLLDKGRAIAVRVRDVNSRYARQIEPLLPEAQQSPFSLAVKRESFPMVYRPTTSARWLDAAMAMKDLTPEQKSTLETVKSGYERELAGLNSKYESAYSKREESWDPIKQLRDAGPDAGFRGMRDAMQSFETEEMRTLRDQRRTLDQSTQDKIKGVLTPDQQGKLPEAGGDRERDRAARDGGGQQEDQPRTRQRRRSAPAGDAPPPPAAEPKSRS